jgi:hypothetical protein
LGNYPGEVDSECPEAGAIIDALIRNLALQGPVPAGYRVKPLGKRQQGLWQINLKVEKRQVRILYAPYGETIVLFRIHKKGSPQEQERAYGLANFPAQKSSLKSFCFRSSPRPELQGRTDWGLATTPALR